MSTEKLKAYLKNKIIDVEGEIKRHKKRNIIVQTTYGSLITLAVIATTVIGIISQLAVPPISIACVASVASVSTVLSTKFNLKKRKEKLVISIRKLNILKDRLDYIVSCNGDISEEECVKLMNEFRDL